MIDMSTALIDAFRKDTITTSARIEIINNRYHNGIMLEKGNYAIWEQDGIKLNNTLCLLDYDHLNNYTPTFNDGEQVTNEGWYSSTISQSDCSINESYSITVKDDKHAQSDMHLIFSRSKKEYAVDFTVTIGETIHTYENNTNTEIVIENVQTDSNVVVHFTKWSVPNAHAKILNVYLGTVYEYEDEDIVRISCDKSLSLTNEEIPSKALQLEVIDKNDSYNIFSTDSEFDKMNKDTRILIYIGVLLEDSIYYINTDVAYFKNIKKGENDLVLNIECQGIINKYSANNWARMLYTDYRLQTLQEIVQGMYFIQDGTIYSPDSLKTNIDFTTLILNEAKKLHRYASRSKSIPQYLNELAIACRTNVIETFDNKILFKRVRTSTPVATIELRNMEEYPQIEKEDNKYNISVNQYTAQSSSDAEEIFNGRFKIPNGVSTRIDPNSDIDFISIASNCSYVANIYNEDGSIYRSGLTEDNNIVYVSLEPTGFWFGVIDGLHPNEWKTRTIELKLNANIMNFSSVEVKKNRYSLDEPYMITDSRAITDYDTVEAVTEWIEYNLNKIFKYKIKINDGFYELGDTVSLNTGIFDANGNSIYRNAVVIGIYYEYDGTLSQVLTLRGE